jgi:transcriptional regulator with XRE-family HTH domain
MDSMAQEEVQRLKRLLARFITERRITYREVDKRLHWSAGLTAKILRGDRHDLRLRNLLSILDAIGVEPSTFFKAAYLDETLASSLGEEPSPRPPLSVWTSLTLDDFTARIREALREVLDARTTI